MLLFSVAAVGEIDSAHSFFFRVSANIVFSRAAAAAAWSPRLQLPSSLRGRGTSDLRDLYVLCSCVRISFHLFFRRCHEVGEFFVLAVRI